MKKEGWTKEVVEKQIKKYQMLFDGTDESLIKWLRDDFGKISNCPICSYRDTACLKLTFDSDCIAAKKHTSCILSNWYRKLIKLQNKCRGSEKLTKLEIITVHRIISARIKFYSDFLKKK